MIWSILRGSIRANPTRSITPGAQPGAILLFDAVESAVMVGVHQQREELKPPPALKRDLSTMGKFILVDCEADGPCPGKGNLTEIGAVYFHDTTKTFHAQLLPVWPEESNYEPQTKARRSESAIPPKDVMEAFSDWIEQVCAGDRPVFVSDNPAFDWQWVNWYFWHFSGRNPFGHSARRIGDIYSGVVGDLRKGSAWKRLRDTPHDHNPVNDAMGNAEALAKILKIMEKQKQTNQHGTT